MTLKADYERYKADLREALEDRYAAPNVKAWEQADRRVRSLRLDLRMLRDEIGDLGPDGFECKLCGGVYPEHEGEGGFDTCLACIDKIEMGLASEDGA